MKSSHEGDRAVHEAPNANPTEIQSTSFVAAVLSDIADMDNAAFRQMLAKATDGAKRGGGGGGKDELRSIIETEDKRAKQLEKKKEKNREKNEAQAAARGGKPGAADAGGYRDRANERRKEANPDYDDALTQMVALGVEESWEWTGLRIRSSVADYTSRAPAPQIRVFEGRPRRRAATPRRSRRRR